MGIHYTALQQKSGRGRGGVVAHEVGGDGEYDKAMTEDNKEIERQRRILAKSWWEGTEG